MLAKGVKIDTIHHKNVAGVIRDQHGNVVRNERGLPTYNPVSLGVSEVARVQSNAFTIWRDYKGEPTESWCYFPKASQCTFSEDGSMTIHEEGEPILTYKFVE